MPGRIIYDPISGADVTTTVRTTLTTTRTLFIRWLFRFQCQLFWDSNTVGTLVDFAFTDDFPIFINKYQTQSIGAAQLGTYTGRAITTPNGVTFVPEPMEIDKLDYGIGFEDHPVDVTWYIDDSKQYNAANTSSGVYLALSPQNLTMKQAMCMGAFNEAPFWIHQAIYSDDPSRGGTFLGTTLMFRGYIRKVTPTKNSLVLSLASLMDVFQQVQLPPQIIMPNSRAVPFYPAAGGTYAGVWFSLITVISPTVIQFQRFAASPAAVPQSGLRDYWFNFTTTTGTNPWQSSFVPGPSWRVQDNDVSSGNTVVVYFYEPPVIPGTVGGINVYGQLSLTSVSNPPGFPYVPPPEYNL